MKTVKGIIISLIVLFGISIMPFSVHAFSSQSLPSPFLGVNVRYYDRDTERYVTSADVDLDFTGLGLICMAGNPCTLWSSQNTTSYLSGTIDTHTGNTNYYLYEYEFVLDNNYVGYVDTNFGVIYVNGNKFIVTDTSGSITITINSYDLSVMNTERWVYPIESFNAIYFCFNNGFPLASLVGVQTYQFPVFYVQQNQKIYGGRIAANDTHRFIFFMDKNNTSTSILNNFTLSSNSLSFDNYKIVQRLVVTSGGTTYLMVSIDIVNSADSSFNYYITWNGSNNTKYMPIYCNSIKNDYISTDFAINFGLSNSMLDNIALIAQGTQSSNNSSSDLEDLADDFTQTSNDVNAIQNSVGQGLTDSLQNVPTTFNFNTGFGAGFITSAQWVRNQFNTLTVNTPFGSLITFSLILGLALLLLGRKLL